jgi:predicted NBD/HSP70 family sugar kinase
MASTPLTGDQRFVKHINRTALLRLLREAPGLSRVDLAARSGLTKSTVSLLSKELIDEGWLAEDEVQVTGALGRRPTPLRLAGRGLALIGAELGPDRIHVVSTSVHGEVQEATQAALADRSPDGACHQLVEMVTRLTAKSTRAGARVLGVGVGLPGAVNTMTGVLQFAPNIGWRQVEVGQRLARELQRSKLGDVPVYCQNEADLAAIGEIEFGQRPADDPLVYISCGVGVGAGIVLNEALFTGATGSAGEIGHTTLHIDGRACSCGRLGCAEAYVGLKAIAREAGQLDRKTQQVDRDSLCAELANPRMRRARQAFMHAGDALGVLLQNAWSTFNPQAIVLGGETVAMGGTHFIDAAIHRLKSFADQAGLPMPEVRVARHGELATAVGGAAFALHSLMRPYGTAGAALRVSGP